LKDHSFDSASLQCADVLPTEKRATSVDVGWKSALLEVHESLYDGDQFETLPTSDQTMVMALDGTWKVESYSNNAWRGAIYIPGSIGMTPSGETSRLRLSSCGSLRPHRTAHLYFSNHILLEAAEEYRLAGTRCCDRPLSALSSDDPILSSGMMVLLRAMETGAPNLYAASVVHWLAAHLLLHHCQGFAQKDSYRAVAASDARLARVIEFMEAYYAHDLSLEALAREAAISKFHFVRVFRKAFGCTPHAALVQIRLKAACKWLTTTSLRVEEVARQCGYPRIDHFGTAFRRRYGMSPSQYRATAQSR
jgi:AraC family transcriptional regulator